MSSIITFIIANKYVLLISVVVFILQFICLSDLAKSRKSDYSYSGYEIVWFEGSVYKIISSTVGFTFEAASFVVSMLYLFFK